MHVRSTNSNIELSNGDGEFVYKALRRGCKVHYSPHAAVRHWVAPHRVEPAYLFNVAAANAAARVYMKPRVSLYGYLRGMLGNAWLIVKSLLLAALAGSSGDRSAYMGHLVRYKVGVTGIGAYFRRLLGGSPVERRDSFAHHENDEIGIQLQDSQSERC